MRYAKIPFNMRNESSAAHVRGANTHTRCGSTRGRDSDHLRVEPHDLLRRSRIRAAELDARAEHRPVVHPTSVFYNVLYGVIIVAFTSFYTAVVLNPNDLAENMRKYGGFVPDPSGKKTASNRPGAVPDHASGAVFLALDRGGSGPPDRRLGMPYLGFGGTSVLIVVGVAPPRHACSRSSRYLLMRHYEVFVKRGRIGAARECDVRLCAVGPPGVGKGTQGRRLRARTAGR